MGVLASGARHFGAQNYKVEIVKCDIYIVLCRSYRTVVYIYVINMGTAVAQWLRCYAANRKVAGSISASVTGFFINIKSCRSHYGPGVDSASNRNEYQEYFLGVKTAGA